MKKQIRSQDSYLLEDSLGYLLFRLSKGLQVIFESRISEVGISAPQWGVLNALYQGQAKSPSEFANFLAVDNAAVSRHLKNLIDLGYLTKTVDLLDKRSYSVNLTKKGCQVVEQIIPISKSLNQEIIESVAVSQRKSFVKSLMALLEHFEILN